MKIPNYNLPAVCDFSVTNVCNAACEFCGFARDKTLTSHQVGPKKTISPRWLLGTSRQTRLISMPIMLTKQNVTAQATRKDCAGNGATSC